jgi:hypothetical protein
MDWTPATLPRISQRTWDTLITLGYLEERREADAANQRLLRLTKGKARRRRPSLFRDQLNHPTFEAYRHVHQSITLPC